MNTNTMKPKASRKLLLLGFLLASVLLFLLSSSYSVSLTSTSSSSLSSFQNLEASSCRKIPPSLVKTIINYATSSITPQQTFQEISVTARVLARRSPCNFLVFGLGHDSPMWSALNHGGRTVFLEEDETWIKNIAGRFPDLESYHVRYGTKLAQADELLAMGTTARECVGAVDFSNDDDKFNSECPLAALTNLPDVFYEVEWDLIMVDAPRGYFLDAPGRMGAIYAAGMAARGRRAAAGTDVFVHDVDRVVEDKFSRAFLCEGYLKEQEGKLRHFTIPSHRANPGISFCP